MNEIVPVTAVEAVKTQQVATRARGGAIVPQNMDEAYRLANAVMQSGLAPKGLGNAQACMVAIMHGLEIGLPPMQALQRIAVINGRPTLWGDGAMALVRGSGKAKSIKEIVEGNGDTRVAVCRVVRKDDPDSPIEGRFSVQDAKTANLWGKSGPWQQFPERMLKMRARAFALRDGFADVLGGMYLAEELQGSDVDQPGRVVAPAPPEQPVQVELPVQMQREKTGADSQASSATTENNQSTKAEDYDASVARLESEMQAAASVETLNAAWLQVEAMKDGMFPPDFETLQDVYEVRKREFEEASDG